MRDDVPKRIRSWRERFGDAFRGAKRGVRGESSFFVHFFAAAVVGATAMALQVTRWEWCLLVLCVTIVMTAEMFNSALERLSKAIDDRYNPQVRDALDIGSAAVLIASIGAAIVGALVLGVGLARMLGWWGA